MEYDLNIITRDMIPSDLYLCERDTKKDWEMIHFYEFENGLKYVIGSNFPIHSVEELIESMEHELNTIIECDDPGELQELYRNDYDMFYKYKDCEKIWNYYHKNHNLLRQVIESYNDESDLSDVSLESNTDNQTDSDFFEELDIDN